MLALVADEEHASIGTGAVLEFLGGRLPEACLVGEPTWLDLVIAHRGYAIVEVAYPSVRAEASLALSREAWEFDGGSAAGAALSGALAEALGARSGRVPAQSGAPYWMESALWEAAGVPAVVCGPAGGGMHAAGEWVDLAQVRAYPTPWSTPSALSAVRPRLTGDDAAVFNFPLA